MYIYPCKIISSITILHCVRSNEWIEGIQCELRKCFGLMTCMKTRRRSKYSCLYAADMNRKMR